MKDSNIAGGLEAGEFEELYDFSFDGFQRKAIDAVSEDKSVLAVAPTGSGKTVIAEYAVWKAFKNRNRVFYTTPIKALSNQKFRDLSRFYGENVGLLTGDNSIRGEARIVVMTTEVLRNMIYEGKTDLTDLEFVILDECHYLMDRFRGAVWEEIIILLPPAVRLIALSATISNPDEFSDWISMLRGEVVVVEESSRPVKLYQKYFVGSRLFELKNEKSINSVNSYIERMKEARRLQKTKHLKLLIPRRPYVIKKLKDIDMIPCLYFVFSRAGCDDAVLRCLEDGIDLTDDFEKDSIGAIIEDRMSVISDDEIEGVCIEEWKESALKGFSSHHAGMLPLLKEMVEDMFAQGLIKVVFATETLSLGINMPARSAVLESLTKFSGEGFKNVSPLEYMQLTGRAGRRGIDEVGYAIVLYNPVLSANEVFELVGARSEPIESSFKLSYNMMINLLSKHERDEVKKVLNASFAQYMANKDVVRLESSANRRRIKAEKSKLHLRCEKQDPVEYLRLKEELEAIRREIAIVKRAQAQELIEHDLIELTCGDIVFLPLKRGGFKGAMICVVLNEASQAGMSVTVMDNKCKRKSISSGDLKYAPQVLGRISFIKGPSVYGKKAREAARILNHYRPPKKKASIVPLNGLMESKKREETEALSFVEDHECFSCKKKGECLAEAAKVRNQFREIEKIERRLAGRMDMMSGAMAGAISVLENMGYLENDIPTERGHALAQIYNECDLVLIEMLSRGSLVDLTPAELATMMSCFVFEGRDFSRREQPDESVCAELIPEGLLLEKYLEAREIESRILELESRNGIEMIRVMDPGFCKKISMWASGCSYEEVQNRYPDISTGDFVRNVKQIIDLLKQIIKGFPDPLIESLSAESLKSLKRGIVNVSSIVDLMEEEILPLR